MSRYVLKGGLKGDYIGFYGSKGKLINIIDVNKEAYNLFDKYEKKLHKTLSFNKVYSDDACVLFYNITQHIDGTECRNKKDEIKYNLELSLYDIDNEEIVDRWEEFITYNELQNVLDVLNRDWLKELKNTHKDYNLLQDMYDNVQV